MAGIVDDLTELPQSWTGRRLISTVVPPLAPLMAVGDVVAANEKATRPGAGATVTPGSPAATLLTGTPSESYDRQEPLPPAPAPEPLPLPAPVAKPPGAGGGLGLGTGPTAGQTMARGAQQTADEQEAGVIQERGAVEKQKAVDQVELDRQQAQREAKLQKAADARAAQLNADLKAKQDVLAKDRIHDMFEGRPLAAIVAALSSGFGAFAATRSGGVNHAQAILDNYAQMFRQKELHRMEGERKDVEGATATKEHDEARADAAVAQLYRTFARERETVLRRRGADDAAVAQDESLQKLVAKGAARDVAWQDQNAQIARQEVNDRARRAAEYASAGHSAAETAKTRAETAAIEAGGGPGGGRAAGVQIQKATLAEHGASALKTIDELRAKGVDLTDADRDQIQRNIQGMKTAEHAGLIGATLGRATVLARSPYEGLSPEKQKLAAQYEILMQKGAGITSPSHAEDEMKHARGMFDLMAPGESPDIRERKLEQLREVVGAAKALGGKYTSQAQQGADAERAAARAARPKMTKAERVRATEFVRNNPRGPQTDEIRKLLLEAP